MNRRLFKKTDLIIILAILFFAFIAYIAYQSQFGGNGNIAEILVDDKVVYTTPLDTDKTFSIDELPNITFQISSGKIRFLHSNCPDKVCVNTGYISQAGQLAVCLPNHAVLKISSNSEFDAVI